MTEITGNLGPVDELELPNTPADRRGILQKLAEENYRLGRIFWLTVCGGVDPFCLIIRPAFSKVLLEAARYVEEEVAQEDSTPLVAYKRARKETCEAITWPWELFRGWSREISRAEVEGDKIDELYRESSIGLCDLRHIYLLFGMQGHQ